MPQDRPTSGRRRPGEKAFAAAVLLTVAAVYAPMLATGTRLSENDDFLMHSARHQALRTDPSPGAATTWAAATPRWPTPRTPPSIR